jgi:hypothetical protein
MLSANGPESEPRRRNGSIPWARVTTLAAKEETYFIRSYAA